jgi:hypothetical protein
MFWSRRHLQPFGISFLAIASLLTFGASLGPNLIQAFVQKQISQQIVWKEDSQPEVWSELASPSPVDPPCVVCLGASQHQSSLGAGRYESDAHPGDPQTSIHFHFFNITNLNAVRAGAKPELVSLRTFLAAPYHCNAMHRRSVMSSISRHHPRPHPAYWRNADTPDCTAF